MADESEAALPVHNTAELKTEEDGRRNPDEIPITPEVPGTETPERMGTGQTVEDEETEVCKEEDFGDVQKTDVLSEEADVVDEKENVAESLGEAHRAESLQEVPTETPPEDLQLFSQYMIVTDTYQEEELQMENMLTLDVDNAVHLNTPKTDSTQLAKEKMGTKKISVTRNLSKMENNQQGREVHKASIERTAKEPQPRTEQSNGETMKPEDGGSRKTKNQPPIVKGSEQKKSIGSSPTACWDGAPPGDTGQAGPAAAADDTSGGADVQQMIAAAEDFGWGPPPLTSRALKRRRRRERHRQKRRCPYREAEPPPSTSGGAHAQEKPGRHRGLRTGPAPSEMPGGRTPSPTSSVEDGKNTNNVAKPKKGISGNHRTSDTAGKNLSAKSEPGHKRCAEEKRGNATDSKSSSKPNAESDRGQSGAKKSNDRNNSRADSRKRENDRKYRKRDKDEHRSSHSKGRSSERWRRRSTERSRSSERRRRRNREKSRSSERRRRRSRERSRCSEFRRRVYREQSRSSERRRKRSREQSRSSERRRKRSRERTRSSEFRRRVYREQSRSSERRRKRSRERTRSSEFRRRVYREQSRSSERRRKRSRERTRSSEFRRRVYREQSRSSERRRRRSREKSRSSERRRKRSRERTRSSEFRRRVYREQSRSSERRRRRSTEKSRSSERWSSKERRKTSRSRSRHGRSPSKDRWRYLSTEKIHKQEKQLLDPKEAIWASERRRDREIWEEEAREVLEKDLERLQLERMCSEREQVDSELQNRRRLLLEEERKEEQEQTYRAKMCYEETVKRPFADVGVPGAWEREAGELGQVRWERIRLERVKLEPEVQERQQFLFAEMDKERELLRKMDYEQTLKIPDIGYSRDWSSDPGWKVQGFPDRSWQGMIGRDQVTGIHRGLRGLYRMELAEAQRTDLSLEAVRYQAMHPNNKKETEMASTFLYKEGILIRTWSPREGFFKEAEVFEDIVVPELYRDEIVKIAHNIPSTAHQGVKRTIRRVLQYFYWPSVFIDVAQYCKACEKCQNLNRLGDVTSLGLHSLPTINIPFKRVSIDVVGPLPFTTNSGKRYILMMVDCASRYPDATALASVEADIVAIALLLMFTRLGFPDEILSNQGENFMSQLVKQLREQCQDKQLRASYYPQMNELVEKFNGTLKQVLRTYAEQHPCDWDEKMQYLLFACREVPQSLTGFSPFELLCGRRVHGTLFLIKETWSGKCVGEDRNLVERLLSARDDLTALTEHIQDDHTQSSRNLWYCHNSGTRVYEVGQRVMILLPVKRQKAQLHWEGPYTVVEIGKYMHYAVGVSVNKLRSYHVNMLKPYLDS
uniref:uncharacterized protein n=1 Tax=Pristiophorus japonicus TaxID=55135 RepID=UPI00398E5D39